MQETLTHDHETRRPNGKLLESSTASPAANAQPDMKKPLFVLSCAAPVVLAFFVMYVWPTAYETYQQTGTTLRVNRFTGETQTLESTGWVTSSNQLPEALDNDMLHRISVDGSLITHGTLHTRIYNGTSDHLHAVTLLLTILNKDRTIKMERPYLAHPEDAGDGSAYGDSGFGARCSYAVQPGETWRVSVAGATGSIIPGLTSVSVAATDDAVHGLPASDIAPAAPKPAPSMPSRPTNRVAAAAPPAAHPMTLPGAIVPRPVAPFQSAVAPPSPHPVAPPASAITTTNVFDPSTPAGLTPLQISSLQERYVTYKRDGKFATDPAAQAWGLAALARNLVHDDHKPDLSKVPTSVLENSLHMIKNYKPTDFLQ